LKTLNTDGLSAKTVETWWFVVLEIAVALVLLNMSKRQPFPGPSKRFASILLGVSLLLLVGQSAPNPTGVQVHLIFLLTYGALGLVFGVKNMLISRDEVIVAPFAGILFSVGGVAVMAGQWGKYSTFEEFLAFATIIALGGAQTWLVFRGLLIGRLPLAWSKAGLVALNRGQLEGEHGALDCFERAWDLDEEHLNPMAWLALTKIETFLGNQEKADHWVARLAEDGGEKSVAPEWISAIEKCLSSLEKK
jgi:hypothetical protein